jgi:hypothetical protein
MGPGVDPLHFRGSVHSVFELALNIQLDSGRLVALVAPVLPNAPATIRADLGGADFNAIAEPGQCAGCRAGILRFELGVAIDLRGAEAWRPKSPNGRPNKAAWQSLYNIVIGAPGISNMGAWPGLDNCLNPDRFAGMTANQLIGSLEPLIGLGPGLTPAGDDFIAGLAAALHWSGVGSLLAPHLPGWAARTTDISRWLLLDSQAGRINAPVCDLAATLASDMTRPAAAAVLKLGHTSGLAMALGLLSGYGFAWPHLADIELAA